MFSVCQDHLFQDSVVKCQVEMNTRYSSLWCLEAYTRVFMHQICCILKYAIRRLVGYFPWVYNYKIWYEVRTYNTNKGKNPKSLYYWFLFYGKDKAIKRALGSPDGKCNTREATGALPAFKVGWAPEPGIT